MSTAVLPPTRRSRPTQSRSSRRSKSTPGSSVSSSSIAERVPEFQKCAKLPRKLPKLANPPREVDYSIIEQHAPDICKSGTPLSYVRDVLAVRGPLLYDSAITGSRLYTTNDINPPIAYVTPTKRVPLYIPPTHVVVASSLGTSSTPQPSKFIPPQFQPIHRRINHAPAMPIHAIVLTSQCTRLPSFNSNYNPQPISTPPFLPSAFEAEDAAWTPPQSVYALPILDLKVPSPPTFLALLEFLYRQDIPRLLGTLLPSLSNINRSFSPTSSPNASPNLSTFIPLKPKSSLSQSEEALQPGGEDAEMKPEDEAPGILPRANVLSPAEVGVISTVAESKRELSACLAAAYKQSTLIEHLYLVYGVWKNALCLGVINDVRSVKLEYRRKAASDDAVSTESQDTIEWRTVPMERHENLWTTLELAWDILIAALDKRIDTDRGIIEERRRERLCQAAQKAALEKAQRRSSRLTLIMEQPDDEDEQKANVLPTSETNDGGPNKVDVVMDEGSCAKDHGNTTGRGQAEEKEQRMEDCAKKYKEAPLGYYSDDEESGDGKREEDPSVEGSSQAPSNISRSTASSAFSDWQYRF